MPSAVAVQDFCIRQTGVISIQTAPRIRDLAKQRCPVPVREPRFDSVVASGGWGLVGAGRTKDGITGGSRITGSNQWPVQQVRERTAGVPNVVRTVVNRHVFDRVVQSLAGVANLQAKVRSDRPIRADDHLML